MALLVAAAAALIAALASKAILEAALQGVYDANPGEVEDAHVGDDPKGPIVQGDRVAVFGTHVYDGFHDGWNEIHPLKLVTRVPEEQFLVWTPVGTIVTAADPPGLPQAIIDLGPLEDDDYRQGLESVRFG